MRERGIGEITLAKENRRIGRMRLLNNAINKTINYRRYGEDCDTWRKIRTSSTLSTIKLMFDPGVKMDSA